MSRPSPLTCLLKNCTGDSVSLVGGKCASLGELINAGIRVPPGFAVTTEAYRQFIAASGAGETIAAIVQDIDEDDLTALESASVQIRGIIESLPFSGQLEDEIAESYRALSTECRISAVPVAVRSSATAEDLPGASFAGQQDTFLWIRGVDEVLAHTAKCFSSLFTGRAIAYRQQMGFAHQQIAISVGVQKMVKSYAAGVLFTLNPINGDRSSIAINSNFGFGESVVSGEVTPDEFIVNKVSLDIQSRTVSKKEVFYTVDPDEQRSTLIDLPPERQSLQSVTDEEILELARMAKAIEEHYGCPLDIEWAIEHDLSGDGNVIILQARPETVWSGKKSEPVSGGGKKSATEHILGSLMAGRKIK